MKKYLLPVWSLLICFLYGPVNGAENLVPTQVGGFILGKSIEKFKDRVDMSTRMNVRYSEYLYEVEIKSAAGFKSGLIAVGTCADPGKIVRIKLKYEDSGKDFFDELLKRYKARLGPPSEYQGDPFQVFTVWKWQLFDKDHNQINVILQHNLQDEEEKIGNAVKMTHMNQMEKEQACFEEKKRRSGAAKKKEETKIIPKLTKDWESFIPK
jgi:hypothetical protein